MEEPTPEGGLAVREAAHNLLRVGLIRPDESLLVGYCQNPNSITSKEIICSVLGDFAGVSIRTAYCRLLSEGEQDGPLTVNGSYFIAGQGLARIAKHFGAEMFWLLP